MADYTADKFQGFYDKMEESIHPPTFLCWFCTFLPLVINKMLDKIPGFDKLDIDAEGMKKKFGLMGEPLFPGHSGKVAASVRSLARMGRSWQIKYLIY